MIGVGSTSMVFAMQDGEDDRLLRKAYARYFKKYFDKSKLFENRYRTFHTSDMPTMHDGTRIGDGVNLVREPYDCSDEVTLGSVEVTLAARSGDYEKLCHLLKDADLREKRWSNALFLASANGKVERVKMLLSEAGQKLNKQDYAAFLSGRDKFDRTALNAASSAGYVETVKVLLSEAARMLSNQDYAAFVKAQDKWGNTAVSAAGADIDIVKVLLSEAARTLSNQDYAAFVNATDKDGETALMSAVRWNYSGRFAKIVKVLLKAGADVDLKDKNGKTAFDLARESEDREVITAFIEYFAAKEWSACPLEVIKEEIMPFVE